MPEWQTDHKLQQYNIMAILSVQNEYINGQSVTADNLNALVNNASFVNTSNGATDDDSLEVHSGGYLQVKDGGITNGKLAAGAVNASSLADGTITVTQLADNAVTTAKIKDSTGATDGVTTAKIADNAITPAKISSNDTLLNVNDTHQTIGLGILANSASSSPKIKMDGNVQIGNQASTVPGELSVTGNGSLNLMSVENTATSGQSVLVIKGPQCILQLQDSQASANTGTYNITMDGGYLQINLINDDGSDGGGLLRLRPNGNLSIAGTLAQNGLT